MIRYTVNIVDTVLPATSHKWTHTHPALTRQAGNLLTKPSLPNLSLGRPPSSQWHWRPRHPLNRWVD